MFASVTKTARSGVFSRIHWAARSPEAERVTQSLPMNQRLTSNGARLLGTAIAASRPRDQSRTNHAARRATATHIIWKYLFMSKTTAVKRATFGMRKRAPTHAARKALLGTLVRKIAMRASTNGTPRFVR